MSGGNTIFLLKLNNPAIPNIFNRQMTSKHKLRSLERKILEILINEYQLFSGIMKYNSILERERNGGQNEIQLEFLYPKLTKLDLREKG